MEIIHSIVLYYNSNICSNPSHSILYCDDNNSSNVEIDESRINYSTLYNVDPDTNLIENVTLPNSNYDTESEHMILFQHRNIFYPDHVRSLPNNLNQLEY